MHNVFISWKHAKQCWTSPFPFEVLREHNRSNKPFFVVFGKIPLQVSQISAPHPKSDHNDLGQIFQTH